MKTERRYKLTLEDKRSYLYAHVIGHAKPGYEASAYLRTIAEHCVRSECPAILIKKDTPEPFAIWDTFAMAPKLAKAASPGIKIAVVDPATDNPPKPTLSVIVGTTSGMDVHIFTNTPEAEHWLLTGQTSGH